MLPCVSLLCIMVFGPPGIALGGGTSAVSRAPATSVQAYGRLNPQCAAWTNACVICTRGTSGDPQCSTPGIACTPGPVVCRTPKAP